MPEFVLDHGTPEASQAFRALDSFTQGYIEAMFFTNASCPDDGDLQDASVADISAEMMTMIIADCTTFQEANAADLDEACDNGRINGYDMERAGHDFWYTRNGHGISYCDRDLGNVGDTLAKAARAWRELHLYRGDDGKLYLA